MKTIPDLLQQHSSSKDIALCAPGRTALTYSQLFEEIQHHSAFYTGLGLQRKSVIALALPNGPEMAVAFLGAACTAIAAPLNPGYRETEFEYYFSDLGADAILLSSEANLDPEHEGAKHPAYRAAQKMGIHILKIATQAITPAGIFSFVQAHSSSTKTSLKADESETALLLHTSGTTSRPKIVPLTQENLVASALNITNSLQLSQNDRCLNIMPLFHIHGLVGCLLSSLTAGSSICCTEGFSVPRFFDWVKEMNPTWYSAVPSMHQAILNRAHMHQDTIAANRLRFIRSSSAALPPSTKQKLEDTFQTAVIEAYGMTEASHQIAINPLPPLKQKPGSVGIASGTKIEILAEDDEKRLPLGETGEIAIRGAGVTSGYLRNPEANLASFTSTGWFRTGDLGYLDSDEYLHITGRLKEIINRGGEKILPAEVDRVLLDHPGIEQAVTFAIPDQMLGEEIAAAVVRKDPSLTAFQLRLFARKHLADHKIPRKIVFLDQIPKGPTGKLQRIGLAKTLGLTGWEAPQAMAWQGPRTDPEKIIAEIWQIVLELPSISIHHDFLDAGGDSISAARIANRISQAFEIPFSIVDFLDASDIAKQAKLVERLLLAEIESISEDEARDILDVLNNGDADE